MITMGRVGTDGITTREGMQIDMTGDGLNISGKATALGSLNDWAAFRDQIRGLQSTDEPAIPFTSANDPTLNGYYTVSQAQATAVPGGQLAKWMDWNVQLVRVADFAMPGLESMLVGGFRSFATTKSFDASTVTPWWALPTGFTDSPMGPGTLTRSVQFNGSNDSVLVGVSPFGTGMTNNTFAPWAIDPALWYKGSCNVEWLYGANYRALTSRQVPVGGTPTNLRAGNGLIRMVVNQTAASGPLAGLSFQLWSGSSWSTAKSFTVMPGGSVTYTNVTSATVTFLTPWMLRLRLTMVEAVGVGPGYPITLDFVLRRGAPFFELVIGEQTGTKHGLKPSTNDPGTNITGGVRGTSNDTDGNRWVMAAGAAYSTTTTTNGSLSDSAGVVQFPMMVGYEIAGSGAASGNAAADLVKQYYGPYGETVAVTGR